MEASDYAHLAYAADDTAIRITLNRPKTGNLIGPDTLRELTHAFVRARSEPGPEVVVLGSTGRLFSAGGDLGSDVAKLAMDGPSLALTTEMFRHVHDDYPAFHAIESCPKTVIGAVQGPAFGAAMTLLMMCDLIIAADTATLSFAPGLWGLVDAPSAARLSQRVGVGRAKDLLFTARSLSAHEAADAGLVQRVVARAQLEPAICEYVDAVRRVSPRARAGLKDLMHQQLPPFGIDHHFASAVGEDFIAGVTAFTNNQPTPWSPEAAVADGHRA